MTPVGFEQANGTLTAAPNSVVRVQDLPVAIVQTKEGLAAIVSCWELDDQEIEDLVKTRRLWLSVAGTGMPPISPATRSPFVTQ